jgi:arsenite oxidase small subunit
MELNDSGKPKERRKFVKSLLALGLVATVTGLLSMFKILAFLPQAGQGTTTAGLSWPRLKLMNVKSLELLKPVTFNYPLVNTPNYLVKLGVKAEGGVGPDEDIVAFSGICQHLGCYYGFQPVGTSPSCNSLYKAVVPMGYCCCHGSQYDFTRAALVIGGPAPRPLPQVMLDYDKATGDLYVIGMGPPNIYGHGPPGITDPTSVLKSDLEGGEVVTDKTLFPG